MCDVNNILLFRFMETNSKMIFFIFFLNFFLHKQHDAKIYKWNSNYRLRDLTRWLGMPTLQPVLLLSSVVRKVALWKYTNTTFINDRHRVWIQILNWNSNFIHPNLVTATLFQWSLVESHNEHTFAAIEVLKMPSVHILVLHLAVRIVTLVLHLAVRIVTTVHETVDTAASVVVSIFMW